MSLWIFMDAFQALLSWEKKEIQTGFLSLVQVLYLFMFIFISLRKYVLLYTQNLTEKGTFLCKQQHTESKMLKFNCICGNIYFSSCSEAINDSLYVLGVKWQFM